MALVEKSIEYWCKICDAGPFAIITKGSCGETIWNNHNNARHNIVVYKKPEKSVEAIATAVVLEHYDQWFHELITDMKEPDKVCLLRDKPFEKMR